MQAQAASDKSAAVLAAEAKADGLGFNPGNKLVTLPRRGMVAHA